MYTTVSRTLQHWALSFLYMWCEKLLSFVLNLIISFAVNSFLHTNIFCCYSSSPGHLRCYSSLSDPPSTIHPSGWDFACIFQAQKPWAIFKHPHHFSLHHTFSKERAQDLHLRTYPMLRLCSHVPYAPHIEYKSATRTSRLVSPKGLPVQAQGLSAIYQ